MMDVAALLSAVEADRGDNARRLILADAVEELAGPEWGGLLREKEPRHVEWKPKTWSWLESKRSERMRVFGESLFGDQFHEYPHELPYPVLRLMDGTAYRVWSVHKSGCYRVDYRSRRAAMADLCRAVVREILKEPK